MNILNLIQTDPPTPSPNSDSTESEPVTGGKGVVFFPVPITTSFLLLLTQVAVLSAGSEASIGAEGRNSHKEEEGR